MKSNIRKSFHIVEHAVCVSLLGFILVTQCTSTKPADTYNRREMVTAAHLGSIEGYSKVYTDESSDYAIYVRENYIAHSLSVGTEVRLAETTGVVAQVSGKEFTVAVDNISKIVPGVSGESVYDKDIPIGFISGWSGDGTVRCIFY